ncbi:unnamed protein product [Trifolium pratense]|uniref:Uncharacterized protein n=1 Tax=Trifolium pratense TaxID=57577 RepID=A0ACB0ICG9_TRIPR|nr:unnamed protein product [Trifolium pratense]
MDGVMQELPKLPALPPPSKLPETDMLVDIGEVQTTPIQNVPTQMSEPLDCGQPETVLPRRCPPPKPPDLGDSENGKGHQETEANLRVSIGKMEVPPEGTHDREVLTMFNTYSMYVDCAFVLKIFHGRQIWNLKDWPSVIFNLKTQVERIVVVWLWMEIEEVLPKSLIWNS